MKFICFALLFVSLSFSQKKTKGEVEILNKSFNYTKLDYSKYGLVHTYVIVLNDDIEGRKIERRIIGALSNEEHLYHTYYYILKLPVDFKGKRKRETVLFEFVKKIEDCSNLFLLLQDDISSLYIKKINSGEKILIAKAIVNGINLGNIKKHLHIKISE